MTPIENDKVWQILGKAPQATPGDDFTKRVMMKISAETQTPARSKYFSLLVKYHKSSMALAASILLILGITALLSPTEAESSIPIASIDIDAMLVEEASLSLGEESLIDAVYTLSSSETGILDSDTLEDFLL
ncbi:MAG: hypothetical protein Q4C05_04780 [Akkermansia sp.]|nr:hypothetical protein [Akkermansia sp.]